MVNKLFLVIAATTLVSPLTSLAEITVKPAGMKVVWNSLGDEFKGFQTYSSKEGLYLSFGVTTSEKNIIAFDAKKSDITVKAGGKDLDGSFEPWERISEDGKTMRVELVSKKLPTDSVNKFQLTGSINVILASKFETKSTEVKVLKKGDKFSLGDNFAFEVGKLAKPSYGDDELEIELKWDRDIPELAKIKFYDEAGKEVEFRKGASSRFGSLGKVVISRSYRFKKKPGKLKVEMDLWSDLESLSVPMNMNVGLAGAVE